MKHRTIIATIAAISLFQMSMVALSPIVASLTQVFPSTSDLMAQTATTFLNLTYVIGSLLTGIISEKIGRRDMAALGIGCVAIVGILAPWITVSMALVFLWSGLLGFGCGLFVPCLTSMILDFLYEKEQPGAISLQTAFVNIGGMGLSFVAGLLAAIYWNRAYLVFLAAIPVFICTLKFLPSKKNEPYVIAEAHGVSVTENAKDPDPCDGTLSQEAETSKENVGKKPRIPLAVWLAALQTFIFGICYFTYSTNISLLLVEKDLTNTTYAGIATAVFMAGGALFGIIFGKMYQIFGRVMPVLAFLMVTGSFEIICLTNGFLPLLIGSFIGGGSISVIFPYLVMSISGNVDPAVSVISSSLIVCVGPNLGSFISPTIVTNISLIAGPLANDRFATMAIVSLVIAVLLLILNLKFGSKGTSAVKR